MRQIHVCAWLLVTAVTLAACSGEQFTSGEPQAKGSDSPATVDARPPRSVAEDGANGGEQPVRAGGDGAGRGGTSGASTGGGGGGSSNFGFTEGGASSVDADDQGCQSGAITFRMLPGATLPQDYLCDAGCGTGWLTLTDAEGTTAFSISSACGTASCETCEVQPCGAAACLPTPLTGKGSHLEWSGSYLAKDTCGNHMACQRAACVKPGKYKARACAALNQGPNLNGGCTPKNEQLCTEVEFEFPAKAVVELRLEP